MFRKTHLLVILLTGIMYFFAHEYYHNAYPWNDLRKSQIKLMLYTGAHTFLKYDNIDTEFQKMFFLKYWNLQHEMRFNFSKIIEPCKNDMKWRPYHVERTPYMITSANYTKTSLHINSAGQYSRLLIETYSLMNTRKYIGGDSWRIFIKGNSSVPITLIDNLDGTYEVSFLIVEPGQYFVEIHLDYTLCDGLKDPPENFFSQGTINQLHRRVERLCEVLTEIMFWFDFNSPYKQWQI